MRTRENDDLVYRTLVQGHYHLWTLSGHTGFGRAPNFRGRPFCRGLSGIRLGAAPSSVSASVTPIILRRLVRPNASDVTYPIQFVECLYPLHLDTDATCNFYWFTEDGGIKTELRRWNPHQNGCSWSASTKWPGRQGTTVSG